RDAGRERRTGRAPSARGEAEPRARAARGARDAACLASSSAAAAFQQPRALLGRGRRVRARCAAPRRVLRATRVAGAARALCPRQKHRAVGRPRSRLCIHRRLERGRGDLARQARFSPSPPRDRATPHTRLNDAHTKLALRTVRPSAFFTTQRQLLFEMRGLSLEQTFEYSVAPL